MMKKQGLISRKRSPNNERNLIEGCRNSTKMGACIPINFEETQTLYILSYKILGNIKTKNIFETLNTKTWRHTTAKIAQ